jgi:CubicO group peptidase (beta-lactamase class C family)
MRYRLGLTALASVLSLQSAWAQERPSVRVDFDARHITRTITSGLADPATGRAVTIDDPVRIASISKLYVALGVLKLVEAGTVDLDRDVSDYLGWKMRNPAYPDAKISLRLLLSHQSSLSDDADYLIPVDQTIRAKLADPKAWDAKHAAGSGWFHYVNLNFPVIASVMEAATGERFDRLIDRLVMKPLKLNACYNWTQCTDARVKQAVVLFRASGEVARDDLKGVRPSCPGVAGAGGACDLTHYTPGWNGAIFSPQGGLRISARDLAKTGQMLLRKGKGFMKPASFIALVGPEWRFDGSNGEGEDGTASGFFCTYGLALHTLGSGGAKCNDEPFGDGHVRIGHSGDAYALKSGLWVDPETGKGTAYFITAIADDAPHGKSAFMAVEEALLQN